MTTNINQMKLLYSIFLFFAITILGGCGENEIENIYPELVFFEVDARSGKPDYILNSYGQFKVFEQIRLAKDKGVGRGGLLVVCSAETIKGTSFYHLYAYDLACPHERRANIKVVPSSDGKARCPECESVFDMFSGVVQSGKSKDNLQRYYAQPDNQNPGVFTITK